MLRDIGTMLPDTWRSMSGRWAPAGNAGSQQSQADAHHRIHAIARMRKPV